MTNEDKNLLLRDLCARLPYDLKCDKDGDVYDLVSVEIPQGFIRIKKMVTHFPVITTRSILREDIVKPYLRPMSSMTEEEWRKMHSCCNAILMRDKRICIGKSRFGSFSELQDAYTTVDYLNAHHFDYRGLIEKGLALPAPEGMYNI